MRGSGFSNFGSSVRASFNQAKNLKGIRGFGSRTLMHDPMGPLSPRIRTLRPEDLLPPLSDEAETDPGGDNDSGDRFGETEVVGFRSDRSDDRKGWYTCFGSTLLFPILTLIFSLGFSGGLALYIWEYRKPVVRPGSFGKLAQNIRPESVQEANFVKARVRAVSGPTLLGSQDGNVSVGAAEGFEWRRVELIYQVRVGTVVESGVLGAANKLETGLMDLPGWKILCSQRVPKPQQRFCDPGDSFPAVIYATERSATASESAMGVLTENGFTGRGTGAFLPIPVVVEFLTNFHPEVFKRWYRINVEETPVSKVMVMRTMFSFYLPTENTGEWKAFVETELDTALQAAAKAGAGPATLFYRADGVEIKEFSASVNIAIIWAMVAALGAFVSTLIVTRRILLACAAPMLAGLASATSSAAVSKYHVDGFVEFPVLAIGTWFLNAVTSADLAIACVGAWESEDAFPRTKFGELARILSDKLNQSEQPTKKSKLKRGCWMCMRIFTWFVDKAFPPRYRHEDNDGLVTESNETPLTDWYAVGRMYWFLSNLLLPSVVSGLVYLLISQQTELLLLQEFTMHAGPGLLMCACFSVVLFPPVIDLGDVLNEKMVAMIGEHGAHGVPWECGASPEWRKRLRLPIEHFALSLNGFPMRVVSLALIVGVCLGFTMSEFTSSFVATAPQLFAAGHRSREGPKVREIYGSLPRNLEAPENTISSARKCTADAFDNATCNWHKCEVEQRQDPAPGHCACKAYHRSKTSSTSGTPTTSTQPASTTTVAPWQTTLPASIAPTGSCSAVARIAGIDNHQDFPQADFWKWAENELGFVLGDGNKQVLEPQPIGSIEMEDWATGEFLVSKQFSIGLKIADQDVPKMEDACVSLLCYCDISPCLLPDEWVKLGQVPYRAPRASDALTTTIPAGGRRLGPEAPPPQGIYAELQRRLMPVGGAPAFLGLRRLQGSTSKVVVSDAMDDIHVIWGLTKTGEIPFRTTNSELKFDDGFSMEDPWTQRSMASLCEGVAPDLQIVLSHCWVLDFKRWVAGQGESYPVRSELFYDRFFRFTMYRESHQSASNAEGGGAGGGVGYDYFWLDESGRISGTFAAFQVKINDENQDVRQLMEAWSAYVTARNGMTHTSSGVAWMASPLFAQSQTQDIVRTSCYLCVGALMVVACLVTFVLTCSLGITVAILISLIASLCSFATFWTGFGGRDIGSMEIVCLSVFLSGLSTPLIRVANAYSYARDRPYLPPDMMLLQQAGDGEDGAVASRSRQFDPKRSACSDMQHRVSAVDLQSLAKQHASEMGEGEILMFPGAINCERQNRVATAMQRGGAPALGLGGAAIIGGLALLPLEMEALGQVGLSILCVGFAVPPAIGFLSLLLLLGFGDSKARWRACCEVRRYTWSRLSGKVVGDGVGFLDGRGTKGGGRQSVKKRISHPDLGDINITGRNLGESAVDPAVPQHQPHTVAALMLGAPFSIATGTAKNPFKKAKKKEEVPMDDQLKQTADDVGGEAGPCILTLDVQGATAKPPYHIVMATRDVINVKG